MLNKQSDTANYIRNIVNKNIPDATIILYGSRSRGDFRSDSDWDFLILVDRLNLTFDERSDLEYKLWSAGQDIGEEVNPLVYTKKQWESLPPSLFKINIKNEGIKL